LTKKDSVIQQIDCETKALWYVAELDDFYCCLVLDCYFYYCSTILQFFLLTFSPLISSLYCLTETFILLEGKSTMFAAAA